MSEEVDKKLYAHYKGVIAGSHSTSNTVSNELRVADATKHITDLVKKRPDIDFAKAEAEAKAEPKESVPETKSKGKK